jgi:hypothetical protein
VATPALVGSGSYNGLAIGRGSRYGITRLSGLDDLPDQRTADEPRDDWGDDSAEDRTGPRYVELDLGLHADNPTHLRQLVDAARAAFRPNLVLPLYLYDSTRLVYAKVRKRALPYDATMLRRTGEGYLQFYCADPLVYEGDLQTLVVHLPAPGTGGLTLPLTLPLTLGDGGVPGSVVATNSGYADTYPLLTIAANAATLPSPSVENVTTGERIDLDLTMLPGDVLVVDSAAGTIMLNGTADRLNARQGLDWLHLQPGDNQLNFRAASNNTQSTLTVAFRSAGI